MSRVSQEPPGQAMAPITRFSTCTNVADTIRASAISQATLVMIRLCKTRAQVSHTHCLSMLSLIAAICSRARLVFMPVEHEGSAISWVRLHEETCPCLCIASCQRLCTTPHPSDSVAMAAYATQKRTRAR